LFESDQQIRFYFDSNVKIYDSRSNAVVKDQIKLLSVNQRPDQTVPYTSDLKWDITSEYVGIDGYIDNKKIIVTFADSDNNGVVDNPQLFIDAVAPTVNPLSKYIVEQKYQISSGQEDYKYVANDPVTGPVIILATTPTSFGSYTTGQYFYFVDADVVMKLVGTKPTPTLDYKVYVGRSGFKFQYIHSADYESRIDPSSSNIHDVFVLTKNYDTQYRQWLSGANISEPLAPSSDELYNTIAPTLNLIKAISDEVVYHPVSYKALFGQTASSELQAIFKITKTPGRVISDNDIKAQAIAAINQFFALENWDFGDTFYFTELATYVMTQLAPNVANFVIVPRQGGLNFGSLFEINAASNQLFINSATVDDIEIITGITSSNIKSVSGTAVASNATSQQTTTSSPYGSI
jgi:hypothetical protein